jgi:hypothetical protein
MTTLRLRPDLEDALSALPDVRLVSVVTAPDATPLEVHVLAAPGRPPEQLASDVRSVALTLFDLELQRRIVSIVQLGEQRTARDASAGPDRLTAAPPDAGPRAVVERVSVSTDRAGSAAEVAIRIGGAELCGRACGGATPAGRPRVIAEATVQALSDLLRDGCGVESVRLLPAGTRQVAVVVLAVRVPRFGELLLTGSALVRSYPDEAVVRAVLDGLNRHLAA